MREFLAGLKNRFTNVGQKNSGLRAGDRNYRAWVGPPDDYDLMAGYQFSLLFAAGLRDTHRLCDVGCGSLRAGRLFIPYLRPGNYYGIEPDKKMLEEGIANEVGRDLIALKKPHFLHGADFPLSEFGVGFDYVLAQSIWSHTYPGLTRDGFQKVARSLSETGVMLATYKEGDPRDREKGSGWLYPGVVPYRWRQIANLLEDADLIGARLDWPHPRQQWFIAAKWENEKTVDAVTEKLRYFETF